MMNKQFRDRKNQNTEFFRILGLQRGESRIDVIREAARAKAKQLSDRTHPSTIDLHRAEVAIATYRLLDPRGRTELYERVQLSCPIDREDCLPPIPPAISSINRQIERASGKSDTIGGDRVVPIRIMGTTVVEQAIEQSPESRAECDAASDLTLEERRNVVRLLRDVDGTSSASWSAVGWIRAKLGI